MFIKIPLGSLWKLANYQAQLYHPDTMFKHGFERIDWGLLDYKETLGRMLARHSARVEQQVCDAIICVEHPKVFTLGQKGGRENILLTDSQLKNQGYSLYEVDRAGNVTFHGPGQAVIYLVMGLKERRMSVKALVKAVEDSLCQVCAHYGINADGDPEKPGAWVGDSKIGAIGMAIPKKVTTHGLAFNANIDLSDFELIRPCGLDARTTSVAEQLGKTIDLGNCFDLLCDSLAENLHQAEDTISHLSLEK
jgi:lipoate-protein ligase B